MVSPTNHQIFLRNISPIISSLLWHYCIFFIFTTSWVEWDSLTPPLKDSFIFWWDLRWGHHWWRMSGETVVTRAVAKWKKIPLGKVVVRQVKLSSGDVAERVVKWAERSALLSLSLSLKRGWPLQVVSRRPQTPLDETIPWRAEVSNRRADSCYSGSCGKVW